MGEHDIRRVAIDRDVAAALDEAVAAGEYPTGDAAIGEALREWKERRENWGYTIAELRAEIRKGDESGLAEDGETFLDGLRDRYDSQARTSPDAE